MYRVKILSGDDEITAALQLAEDVFMQFEAPAFSERGTKSFTEFIWGSTVKEMLAGGTLVIWGCYAEGRLAGMMALRKSSHISLAFVRGEFHRRGIGRMLYAEAKRYALAKGVKRITVNASDYGVPFYRAMGFKETDMQLEADGIFYTPMECKL
ncbi:MAG: GNAT family N-acetyltransferase [Ruminococcus sp.]|nr:GNAT family N-acetyltransferase [Ruminococcus sp.]MCM1380720.1 GNAT family N-acetyltransferase [Muribaculaceae bacterium]MCM1479778.1 GNAT family N-acetyltransferase [Muribaculaceae bacterium]